MTLDDPWRYVRLCLRADIPVGVEHNMQCQEVPADPRVSVVFERMRKYEPERVRRLNYDYLAAACTGDLQPRTDCELLQAARAEIAGRDKSAETLAGQYLAAVSYLADLGLEIARLAEAARSAHSRGWDENAALLHKLAVDLERETARAIALACIAGARSALARPPQGGDGT